MHSDARYSSGQPEADPRMSRDGVSEDSEACAGRMKRGTYFMSREVPCAGPTRTHGERRRDDSFMGVSWCYYNFVVVGI